MNRVVAAVLACSGLMPAVALGAGGDLAVGVGVTPSGPVAVGETVTFVLTVTNTSAETAEDVRFFDVLPGNSSDSRQPSAGHVKWMSQSYTSDPALTCSGEPGPADMPPYGTTCGVDRPMAGGESFTLTIVGRADRAGHAVNYAGATSSHFAYDPATGTTGPVDDDPNQSNNSSETAFEIVEPPPEVEHGDARDNTLLGGPGRDSLFGGGGNDVLKGFGADDRLDGGAGNDRLQGGPGNDMIKGGSGRDVVAGGPGRDTVEAADGARDTVDCGTGRDTVTADANDELHGCEVRRLRH
jgi:hypothetical protein